MLSDPPATQPAMQTSRYALSIALLSHIKSLPHPACTPCLAPSLVLHAMLSGATAETVGAEHFGIQTADPSHFWTRERTGLGLPVELIELLCALDAMSGTGSETVADLQLACLEPLPFPLPAASAQMRRLAAGKLP